jgi:hypothetical protein
MRGGSDSPGFFSSSSWRSKTTDDLDDSFTRLQTRVSQLAQLAERVFGGYDLPFPISLDPSVSPDELAECSVLFLPPFVALRYRRVPVEGVSTSLR